MTAVLALMRILFCLSGCKQPCLLANKPGKNVDAKRKPFYYITLVNAELSFNAYFQAASSYLLGAVLRRI